MRAIDSAVVVVVGVFLVLVAVISAAGGIPQLPAVVIVATMALTGLALSLHRANRRAQRLQLEATYQTAMQTQAMFSIVATIQPTAPLPPLGGWAASPDLLRLLLDILLRERPMVVLEASSGASTLVLAYGQQRLGAGGRVISLEHDAEHAARTRASLAAAGLSEVATVIHAPLVPYTIDGATWLWYETASLPDFPPAGLLVVDGPPRTIQPLARYPALPLLMNRLAPVATIVMDDANRPDEQIIAERWARLGGGWQLETPPTEKGAAVLRRFATSG